MSAAGRQVSLLDLDIEGLQALLDSGALTSVELVQAYTERTLEINNVLCAVSELNQDALMIAENLDRERARGLLRGPLHGIPILVKDNIATGDQMGNTAGSFALFGATVGRDATIVAKLRASGAIILGKATMGEWAQCRSRKTSGSHGWSAVGGQTAGAYCANQDPSGSSSGSAVAVAVGLTAGAIGTETSGSIVLPAEKANLVGIKPTLGLTSRDLTIPISIRQDSTGPMAKTVEDAAHILTVIGGKDPNDSWTWDQPFSTTPDYVRCCHVLGLLGTRIGVPRNGIDYFEKPAAIMAAFEEALDWMKNVGAAIVDHADFARFDFAAFSLNASIVLDTDFVAGLEQYFAALTTNPNNLRNLQDLADFTIAEPREEFPDRDMYVWARQLSREIRYDSPESLAAYEANLLAGEEFGVTGVLDRFNLDVLAMPTFASFHLPAIAGLPLITVPLGRFPANTPIEMNPKGTMVSIGPNVPFGISFIGRRWSEEKLIAVAYAFEQMTKVRGTIRPQIVPRFELGDHPRGEEAIGGGSVPAEGNGHAVGNGHGEDAS